MNLSILPPELLIQITTNLNLQSIHSLSQLNSTFHAFAIDNSESIYRNFALLHLSAPQTSSSAAPVIKSEISNELEDQIKQQKVMNGAYDHIKSWKQFVMKKVQLSQNWKTGTSISKVTPVQVIPTRIAPEISLWRWKLGENQIIASGVESSIYTIDLDGHVTSVTEKNGSYNHVEWTEGYLCLSAQNRCFEISKTSSTSAGYTILATLQSPFECRASKARYPYFIAFSTQVETVFVWDLRLLEQQIDTSDPVTPHLSISVSAGAVERGFLTYLDFDKDLLYLAGTDQVQQWRWTQEDSHSTSYQGKMLASNPLFVIDDSEYNAVHHSERMVVSLNMASQLIVEFKNGPIFALSFRGYQFDQLSVENERIVFAAIQLDSQVMSLFLLDFSSGSTVPPVPICLYYGLPVRHSISRVEMNSNAVFVLVNSHYYRSSEFRRKIESSRSESSYFWSTLEGDHFISEAVSHFDIVVPVIEDGEDEVGFVDEDNFDAILTLTFD